MAEPLLRVDDLRTHFRTPDGLARAVDGVSFSIDRGECLALVGESGCGKSVTALSILGLIDRPPGLIEGAISFEGRDLLSLPQDDLRRIRGDRIAMIFQEPMASLNPVFTAGFQIVEAIREHRRVRRAEARRQAIDLLARVGIPEPERRFDEYPHQLSGGMQQRVMIAMALACRPALLIADEPTTALDVTIQAQILDLIRDLRRAFEMAVLLITHDLGIVRENAGRVAVMYAGRIVESAPTEALFRAPRHPYTIRLFRSVPTRGKRGQALDAIAGIVPKATAFPPGCRFADRCAHAFEPCRRIEPREIEVGDGHGVACHLFDREGDRGSGSAPRAAGGRAAGAPSGGARIPAAGDA
ncbi:MAG: ABC transporter ATP-binding protein, partial [Planctomycetes bacterium]|nr:ABC transporter ATP-binding protein [Planctomycetota bacterium]